MVGSAVPRDGLGGDDALVAGGALPAGAGSVTDGVCAQALAQRQESRNITDAERRDAITAPEPHAKRQPTNRRRCPAGAACCHLAIASMMMSINVHTHAAPRRSPAAMARHLEHIMIKPKGRRIAVALIACCLTASARAETPEEWVKLGARIHGFFGSYLPVGIRIGLDALQRLDAKPRGVTVVYYSGPKSPCPCPADGIAIATVASVG